MNILVELRNSLAAALADCGGSTPELLETLRPAGDPKFGDYQANCAMSLAKTLGKSPREVATQIAASLQKNPNFAALCHPPEIAGPGFINIRLRDEVLARHVAANLSDPRLGVPRESPARTFVIDYSGPNVAKPMHVGHIRSTVIGDALARTLRFLGHRVVGDNHVGDWGTQFGMILYGYKHFVDAAALERQPVQELARLYKLVRQLVDYHAAVINLPKQQEVLAQREAALARQKAEVSPDPKTAKQQEKAIRQQSESLAELREEVRGLQKRIATVSESAELSQLAAAHPGIGAAVLAETAKLHAGDAENVALWQRFLPACRAEIDRIYQRLNIQFDTQLGESFYHERQAPLVEELLAKGIATTSNGATVVFLDGFDTPMLIRKQDGAYLYATSDLATIQYRLDQYQPEEILYVVDHRQSLHFEQLFAAARRCWNLDHVRLRHIKFGTVLGQDGKPYKTREGKAEGLDALLDEAIERAARELASRREQITPDPAAESPITAQQDGIARIVGLSAVKYADLCQNRESDYQFDFDKMCALKGNTAAYMQYAYARVKSIFERGGRGSLDQAGEILGQGELRLEHPAERALALAALRFPEAIALVLADYRPHQLTTYLFELANQFSAFYEVCPVLQADTPTQLATRLALCALTARVLRQGLELLGIEVVERM
ncbi:MAG: arginine--tRNA ligase [Pirellulales bacterium]|nr:arginine--tRNA ligase [Pirellulales bacterium]